MRRTKIVCTLGPSSSTPEQIRKLMLAGMDVARLNFSHGDHALHALTINTIRTCAQELGHNIAILADLQGPKIRTGKLESRGTISLIPGASITITTRDIPGNEKCISTTYDALPGDVRPGDRIMMADGAVELRVESIVDNEVHCRVVYGGQLGEHKGINLPGVAVSAPCLTDKDLEDLSFALSQGVDYIALSFVRQPSDLINLRTYIKEARSDARIIAKIERPEAITCFDQILLHTDAVMVARGDLGVELPLYQVPQEQKHIIRMCRLAGVPVITATQMLESMMDNPRPTRAEVNDIANAVYDGTDAVMLSGETAAGQYPELAVQTMARIIEESDNAVASPKNQSIRHISIQSGEMNHSIAIGQAVEVICDSLHPKRIVCFTSSGYTAAMIARYRPATPITACTLTETACRRCALIWGVEAIRISSDRNLEELFHQADELLIRNKFASEGDTVVIVAGTPLGIEGRTNLVHLHTVGQP